MRKQNSLKTFYILLITQTVSLIGSRMTSLAIGIHIFQDTNAVTPLAMVGFFMTLPALLSAGVAGVLADRWNRRYVMAIADAGQALATLLLLLSFASGAFQLWHLYAVTILSALFAMFQGPAFMASVTMLVPDEHRDRANAIQQLTWPTSGILAPVLAGGLFAMVGVVGVMTIDLVTFGIAMVVVLAVSIPHPEQSAEGRAMTPDKMWKEALVGLRFLWSKRMLFWLMISAAVANFLIGGALMMDTPYILTLTGSEAMLGIILGVMSVGPVIGSLLMSIWGGTTPRIHTIVPGMAMEGVGLIIFGLARDPFWLGAGLFVALLPVPFVNSAFMSLFQVKVPPDLQGRVFSAIGQLSMLLSPLSYYLVGPLADKVLEPAVGSASWQIVAPLVGNEPGSGMGLMILVYGGLMVGILLAFYALPAVRHMEAALPDYKVVAQKDSVPGEALENEAMPKQLVLESELV